MREAVANGLRALGLITWVSVLVYNVIPMFGQPTLAGTVPSIGYGLLLGYLVLAAVCLLHRAGIGLMSVTALLLVAGVTMMNYWRFDLQPNDLWSPGHWAIPLVAAAIVNLPRAWYLYGTAVLVVLLAASEAFASWWSWLPVSALQIGPVVLMWPPLLSVLLFGDGLMSLVEDQQKAAVVKDRAQVRLAEQQAQVRARRETARLLHDHVLHALHALNSPSRTIDDDMVRLECRDAVEALALPQRRSESVQVEDLLRHDAALVRSGAQLLGRSDPIPTAAAESLTAAAHEALRNVIRHSGARNCQVVVSQQGPQCRVSILDDGEGFDPRTLPDGRLGVRRSVVQRLDDIGGQAQVRSAPGQGTEVVLSWPRDPHSSSLALREQPTDKVRTALARSAVPGMLAGVIMSFTMFPHTTRPLLALANGLVMAGFGFFLTAQLHRRPIGDRGAALVMAAILVGWVVNLAVAPQTPTTVFLLWTAWLGTALVQQVALSGSVGRGVVVTVVWYAAVLGAIEVRYGLNEHWLRYGSTLTSTLSLLGSALAALAVARRTTADEEAQARLTSRLRAATARLQVDNRLDHFWSNRVTKEALPLLRDVAEHRQDPGDPQVRDAALQLEVGLRDELRLGPGQGPLLAILALRREQGWAIQTLLTSDDDPRALRAAATLLEVLGPPQHDGQVVTLSARHEVASAVVLEAAPAQWSRWSSLLDSPSSQVEVDRDFVRLSLQQDDTPPSSFLMAWLPDTGSAPLPGDRLEA
ncbi:sensor histidine kinase [Luteococcus sp. OSA5]|uniref:sensor histidine kinase n=1 Tax=Luteococcus sp. OSA5 TaxID=3401630 RepID=UPI003B42BCC6